MDISVGAQPNESLRDAYAELLGEHPGSLIDLSTMPRQVRGLATWSRPCRGRARLIRGDQQQGRGIGEDQRVT